MTALWGAAAHAQLSSVGPGPRARSLDARSVDLADGKLYLTWASIAIGQPGAGGLSYDHGTWWGGASAPFGTLNKSGSVITVTLGGTSETFTASGGGFIQDQGTPSTLTYVAANDTYYYTLADGTLAIFEHSKRPQSPWIANEGLLVQLVRPDGEVLNYIYKSYTGYGGNAVNRPTSISNNLGYQINFEYASDVDSSINSLSMTKVTAFNRSVEYCSTVAEHCTFGYTWPTLTFSNGSQTVTDTTGRSVTVNPNVLANTIVVSRTGLLDWTYTLDGSGQVTTVNNGAANWTYAYSTPPGDPDTFQAVITDPLGKLQTVRTYKPRATLSYDSVSRVDVEYQYGRPWRGQLPSGQGAQFGYDSRGNAVQTTRLSNDPLWWANIPLYDPRPSSCANAKTCNRPYAHIDGRGNTTDFTYNANNGAVETVMSPTVNGVRPTTTNLYQQVQGYVKNASGTLEPTGSMVWRDERSKTCVANTGSCAGTASELKVISGFAYSNNGQRTALLQAAGDNSVVKTTTWTYTNAGDVASEDTGATSFFRYDGARRLVGKIGPAFTTDAGATRRNATRISYATNGQVSLTETGYTTGFDDPAWAAFVSLQQEDREYDSLGRLTKATFRSGATKYRVTQYAYNARNEVICVAQRRNAAVFNSLPSSACDPSSPNTGPDLITQYTYDDAGRVTKIVDADGPGGANDIKEYIYSADGTLALVTDTRDSSYSYLYDGHNRLRARRYPHPSSGGPDPADVESYSYNNEDNQNYFASRAANRGGTPAITRTFDPLNRLSTNSAPSQAWAYDDGGRVTNITHPDASLSFGYNALGWQTSAGGAYGASYQYDSLGRRTRMTWPDSGLYVTYEYDAASHLTAIKENGATTLVSFTYDDLGRRRRKTFFNGHSMVYGYDSGSRLTQLDYPFWPHSIALTYDGASRIKTKSSDFAPFIYSNHGAVDRTYAAADHLNRLVTASQGGGVVATYAHDDNGNLTGDGAGPATTFDNLNRWAANAAGVSMQYDALSRLHRVYKSGVGGQDFGYDGDDLITEYAAGTGTIIKRYVHGPGADEPLIAYEGAGTANKRALTSDERGSIIAVSAANNDTLAVISYDEYGNYYDASHSQLFSRFGYTGQAWIPEIGRYYYKARIYDPALGRFMQTDPIRLDAGMNMYAYVGGDPINRSDPSGLRGCPFTNDFDGAIDPFATYDECGTPVSEVEVKASPNYHDAESYERGMAIVHAGRPGAYDPLLSNGSRSELACSGAKDIEALAEVSTKIATGALLAELFSSNKRLSIQLRKFIKFTGGTIGKLATPAALGAGAVAGAVYATQGADPFAVLADIGAELLADAAESRAVGVVAGPVAEALIERSYDPTNPCKVK